MDRNCTGRGVSVGHFPVAPFNRAAHSDDVHPVPLVVVIDDEAPVGEVAGYVLSMHGFEVKVATSGAAGLQLVRETMPDAVVCDVRMPDFTGEQVVLALRADDRTSRIPVIFISGQCDPHILELGDAFHEKPFNCKELVATVARLIEERRPLP